jgi:hypothetical protein
LVSATSPESFFGNETFQKSLCRKKTNPEEFWSVTSREQKLSGSGKVSDNADRI